jgi:hypothetical protein
MGGDQTVATAGDAGGNTVSGAVPVAALRPDALRAVAEEVRAAFPRAYAATELVLIDVDPRRVHAFWNVPLEHLHRAQAELADGGAAPLVLRVTAADDGVDGPIASEVEVQGLQSQVYVEIWEEPRHYRARLGLRRPDGTLLTLATSNDVALPALGPAETFVPAAPASPGAEPIDEAAATAAYLAEPPAPLPLESVLAVSSFALGRAQGGIELHAELHVFGRTRPGSDLSLFGRRVLLRPDGSFSVTRPLPSGSSLLTALLADFAAAE